MATFLTYSNGRPKKATASDTIALGSLALAAGGVGETIATVTKIHDEDDMVGNDATGLATQQSIKAYVDARAAATITLADSTDTTSYVVIADSDTGDLAPKSDAGLTYNAGTGMLTATGLTGPLTGVASTATALATPRTIGGTSFDGTANIAVGLAATATILATARNIGGVSFDGSAAITLPGVNAAGSQSTSGTAAIATTVTVADTTDTSCSVALWESATGNLAPKSDAGLTYNAGTGMLTATGLTGPLTGNASGSSASCTGNAATATALATGRNINGVSFDGTGSITLTAVACSDISAIGSGSIISAAERTLLTATAGTVSASKALIVDASKDLTGINDLTVAGNLTVSGTTTTVSSTVLTVADPIFQVGADTDDSKDRGLVMLYNDGASKKAWMGWDESVNKFGMLSAATESGSQVMSGTTGILIADLEGDVTGDLTGNADTVTTNANLTGGVTSVGNATTVVTNANLTGGVTSVGNATTVVTNANLTGMVTSVGNATSLGSFTKAQLTSAVSDGTPIYSGDTATAATTATNATNIGTAAETGDATCSILFAGAVSGNQAAKTNTGLTFNATNGTLTCLALGDGVGAVTPSDLIGCSGAQRIVAAEDIKAGELVALIGNGSDIGQMTAANNTETNLDNGHYDSIIGFCVANVSDGGTETVICTPGAKVTVPVAFSTTADLDLVHGKAVYVNNDTNGGITQTIPSAGAIIHVGVAISDTEYIFTGVNISLIND